MSNLAGNSLVTTQDLGTLSQWHELEAGVGYFSPDQNRSSLRNFRSSLRSHSRRVITNTQPFRRHRSGISAFTSQLPADSLAETAAPIAPQLSVADRIYPADAGVVNVKDYGAKGDGVSDDTAAIQRAIREHLGFNDQKKIIYFPSGTYLVSNTLEWKDTNNQWDTFLTLEGQNQSSTIIKLQDHATGFTNSDTPKAVIYTASIDSASGNRAHNNFIQNLTIDTGRDNAGAIGIDYLANNRGAIRDVTIRSSDGAGQVGLNMTRYGPGPSLIQNLQVDGFNYGIRTGNFEYSLTFDNIELERQRVAGISNANNVLAIEDLVSNNTVPAVENLSRNGLIVLVNGSLNGGAAPNTAIVNTGVLYARNVTTTGYQAAVREDGAIVPGIALTEYVSDAVRSVFPNSGTSLGLPIEQAPVFREADLNNWTSVTAYGAVANDGKDDTAAIQAALDSGKTTVYFPTGVYHVTRTLRVRGNVRKIEGLESRLMPLGQAFGNARSPQVMLRFEPGTHDTVTLERLNLLGRPAGGVGVEQATAQTLVIRDAEITGEVASYRSTAGAGKLFLEDVVGRIWRFDHPQAIWARHLNAEGNYLKIRNNGANLWILGLKTEGASTVIETNQGGSTEVLGGLLYPVHTVPSNVPAFISNDSRQSLIYAVSASRSTDYNYQQQIQETKQGVTRVLTRNKLRRRGFGSIMPLFVG